LFGDPSSLIPSHNIWPYFQPKYLLDLALFREVARFEFFFRLFDLMRRLRRTGARLYPWTSCPLHKVPIETDGRFHDWMGASCALAPFKFKSAIFYQSISDCWFIFLLVLLPSSVDLHSSVCSSCSSSPFWSGFRSGEAIEEAAKFVLFLGTE